MITSVQMAQALAERGVYRGVDNLSDAGVELLPVEW